MGAIEVVVNHINILPGKRILFPGFFMDNWV